eukprot:jgi/Psemu1/29709/gm1.29709_g
MNNQFPPPNDSDVVFRAGYYSIRSRGLLAWLGMMNASAQRFLVADGPNAARQQLSWDIEIIILRVQNDGGRFLRLDPVTGNYIGLSDEVARRVTRRQILVLSELILELSREGEATDLENISRAESRPLGAPMPPMPPMPSTGPVPAGLPMPPIVSMARLVITVEENRYDDDQARDRIDREEQEGREEQEE